MKHINSQIPLLIHTSAQEKVYSFISFPHPENHPDVLSVNPDGEGITIEMVRTLQGEVLAKPYQADARFFILRSLELATIEAQQALLKLLEEPPQHIRFLLTTSSPNMVLPTILSRVELVLEEKNSEVETSKLEELLKLSLGQRLHWASSPEVQEKPIDTVLNLMNQQIQLFELKPGEDQIKKLKIFDKTLKMLRAKTNAKLAIEWMVMHI